MALLGEILESDLDEGVDKTSDLSGPDRVELEPAAWPPQPVIQQGTCRAKPYGTIRSQKLDERVDRCRGSRNQTSAKALDVVRSRLRDPLAKARITEAPTDGRDRTARGLSGLRIARARPQSRNEQFVPTDVPCHSTSNKVTKAGPRLRRNVSGIPL